MLCIRSSGAAGKTYENRKIPLNGRSRCAFSGIFTWVRSAVGQKLKPASNAAVTASPQKVFSPLSVVLSLE